VGRLYEVAIIAETFHIMPPLAAYYMDRDPDRISFLCLELLHAARAKAVHDRADKAEIEAFKKHSAELMAEIEQAVCDQIEEEMAAEAAAMEG
jgi:hypothetical protein